MSTDHSRRKDGIFPLNEACRHGSKEQVVYCLQHRADPSVHAEDGYTALHSAAAENHTDIVELLLSLPYSCDVNARNNYSETPLHVACLNGCCESARRLAQHGSDPDARDGKGNTVLHLSAASGSCELITCVMQEMKGIALLDSQNKDLDTAAHCAARLGCHEAFSALCKLGANLEVQNRWHRTPLEEFSQYNHSSPAESALLEERGEENRRKNGTRESSPLQRNSRSKSESRKSRKSEREPEKPKRSKSESRKTKSELPESKREPRKTKNEPQEPKRSQSESRKTKRNENEPQEPKRTLSESRKAKRGGVGEGSGVQSATNITQDDIQVASAATYYPTHCQSGAEKGQQSNCASASASATDIETRCATGTCSTPLWGLGRKKAYHLQHSRVDALSGGRERVQSDKLPRRKKDRLEATGSGPCTPLRERTHSDKRHLSKSPPKSEESLV